MIFRFVLMAFWALVPGVLTADMQDTQEPAVSPFSAELLRKWNSLFGFSTSDEGFNQCLYHLGPQPVRALTKFTNERFHEGFLDESAMWMEMFFRNEANPYAHLKKPSRYYLGEKGENSLLFYQWGAGDYQFQLLESCSAVLLRVKPMAKPLEVSKGVAGEQVAALLERLVHLEEVQKKGKIVQQFRLPIRLGTATIFSNAGRLEVEPVSSWTDQIIGFVTNRDICILLLKAAEGRASPDLPPDWQWLKPNLYEKDGKTRVFKARKG